MSLRDNIFMVASPARSGSTFLVHLLRSHPDVGCHGEVLVGEGVTGIWGTYQEKSQQDPTVLECLAEERERSLERYLYKYILDAQGKRAVGFKLKSDELVLPEYAALKKIVQRDTDLAIIHLTRKNLLERYLSWYIVNHVTGVTLVHAKQELPSISAVHLDPAACLADFETAREREAFMRELFRDHRSLDVDYEDIADGNEGAHHALCDFLGVTRRTLTAPTRKIVRAPLHEAISNYSDLQAFFADTPYAHFFTADSRESSGLGVDP